MHIQYEFEKNIREMIKRQQMIRPGEKVLLALSGGADSVCLFRVLLSLKETLSFDLEAVTVNHMLRETADRDVAFVRALCDRFAVPLHCRQVDVASFAKAQRMGTEEAARIARYEVFDETAARIGAARVALAHHEDDQAETILFHLCRGCGLEGLRGMEPVSGLYIRPLLGQGRAAIEAYLSAIGQDYVTDETNFETIYSRNVLRNRVMPVLTADICEKTQQHIAKTGERIGELEDFIGFTVQQAFETCVQKLEAERKDRQALVLDILSLKQLHPYVQSELIRACLYRLCGTRKDIAGVHIQDVRALLCKQTGSRICLPYQMQARRSYDTLILEKLPQEQDKVCKNAAQASPDEQVPGPYVLTGEEQEGFCREYPMLSGRILSVNVFARPKDANIPTKACTKWFDYAKIEKPLVLRTPRRGDYFVLPDGHKKYLKDYMKNEKIPAEQRSQMPVLAMGSHVIYMIGRRISQAVKVSEETEVIVQISIR